MSERKELAARLRAVAEEMRECEWLDQNIAPVLRAADLLDPPARGRTVVEESESLNRTSLPHMCRDGHEEIRHAGDDELCPVCRAKNEAERAREERDAVLAQTYRLREALDAAQRIVRRKADREAGREET